MDWLLTGFCHFLVDSDKIYPSQISEILMVVILTASGSQIHYRLVNMLADKVMTIYLLFRHKLKVFKFILVVI